VGRRETQTTCNLIRQLFLGCVSREAFLKGVFVLPALGSKLHETI
jgi:hypothetical protein